MSTASKLGKGKFSGDLSTFSIFEICQFLMIVRQTGTLAIKSRDGSATIQFEEGQIVSVRDGGRKRGEEAFFGLISWTRGAFDFNPGGVSLPTNTRLGIATDALLLEAARRLDEGELESEGTSEPSFEKTQSYRENRLFATEFADLLASLESYSGEHIDFSQEVSLESILSYANRWNASHVYLQAGHTPRARSDRGVISLGRSAVSTRAMDQIIGRYFARPSDEATRVVEGQLEGGETFRIEYSRYQEVDRLTLIPLLAEAPDLSTYGSSIDSIIQSLRSRRGVFLVGSSPRGGKSTLAASLAASAASRAQRHVILFEESRRFDLREPSGYLENRDLDLSRIQPDGILAELWARKADVLVLDAVRNQTLANVALDAAASGAVVIPTVEAYDVADAVLRFVSYAPEAERPQLAARLAESILGIALVVPPDHASLAGDRKSGRTQPSYEMQLLPRVPGLPEAIREGNLTAVQRHVIDPANNPLPRPDALTQNLRRAG